MRFLTKFLELNGYSCYFKCKANVVNEGLMLAFRNNRFKLIDNESFSVRISDLLDTEKYPENKDISLYLSKKEELFTKFSTRPTVLQVF